MRGTCFFSVTSKLCCTELPRRTCTAPYFMSHNACALVTSKAVHRVVEFIPSVQTLKEPIEDFIEKLL